MPSTLFLDHTLSMVDAVLLSLALLSTILSVNTFSKRDILIIGDSSSESVVPLPGVGEKIPRQFDDVRPWNSGSKR